MSLAILHHKRGNMKNARKVFENSLQNMHHTGELLQTWGAFEEQYGDMENARELFEEATQQQPTHVESWKSLARVESHLGHVDAARAVLTMASQHIPNDALLLIELGKIEQRHRNFIEARAAFEKALKLDSTNAALWNMRALLELPIDAERAKNIVESALNVIPRYEKKSWSILMCTYGRAFAAMEDYEKAVQAFQNSFKLMPKNYETHMIYAESVLVPNEAWGEAKKHLLAARKILPRTHKRRAVVEKKLQAVERAMEQAAVAEAEAEADTTADGDDDDNNEFEDEDEDEEHTQ
jgi:crooked neck